MAGTGNSMSAGTSTHITYAITVHATLVNAFKYITLQTCTCMDKTNLLICKGVDRLHMKGMVYHLLTFEVFCVVSIHTIN